MKLVANVYTGSYDPIKNDKPVARIFQISDGEKKKYEIKENYTVTDLDGPKLADFGEWRELSKSNNQCMFFVPVYTIIEAQKPLKQI